MLKSVCLLMLLSLVLISSIYAQEKEQWPLVNSLSQKHPDSALIILKKLHAQAVEKNDARTEGICLQQMGQICYNIGHYAQALDYYLHADKVFSTIDAPNLAAANMVKLGVLYYYNKQLQQSRSMYNKALTIYKQNR
jgi:tetratricopeptide (TPR) repeat protein